MPSPFDPKPTDPKPSILERDLRWLFRHSAKIGMILALLCHFTPPRYKVLCDRIVALCYNRTESTPVIEAPRVPEDTHQ